ncbi:toprim domain-containing protein [Phenylobacterium sp.]|jgi:putative DNA primase/helicase|uniref:toprim domain-containing protein n=1 Tax=Phenylobacterium sp. TaxID=1871053 RepID=UPI000C8BFC5B|nr:toprim domain-containing protein [Phenylobacterium sp.]MAK81939.1 virulence-associated protein E [Phenylobacterium sp.]MCA6241186.1 toprim domain-containing protein [Phenylobacterium sp.]|tara:strand:+ start:6607 stop:7563 length:957 start_codon:yes stop_codon:yes gene_type:complete
MSLRTIVQTLGGDLYDQGRRANIPAPGHSAEDRSVSLLLEDDRVVVHTFGDGDWRAVLDFLRDQRLIDAANAPLDGPGRPVGARPARPVVSRLERRDAAMRLWEGGRAVVGTLSARHCRLRGVERPLPGPEVLRHNTEAAVSAYRRQGYTRPALLAAIHDVDGIFTAVEVTYLAANSARASDLRLPRKTVGPAPGGCAVQLDPAAPEMLVGEGVFTTLSATERFDLPGWALLSTRNLRVWSPPEGVRSVLIAADRGKDGEASAARLQARLSAGGVAASIALPPAPFGDWNEWSDDVRRQARRQRRGEEGTGRVRPGAG